MKNFLLAVLVLGTTFAYGAEVTVLDANISGLTTSQANVNARFQMDTKTGDGYVDVSVWEYRFGGGYYGPGYPGPIGYPGGYPGGYYPAPMPTPVTVYHNQVKVDGLSLVGDKVMYQNVECGTLGVSTVFKRPTIYLSGNCDLESKIVLERYNTRVVVDLLTK